MARVEIDNVSKSFGSIDVFSGLNIDIKHGEFTGVGAASRCVWSSGVNRWGQTHARRLAGRGFPHVLRCARPPHSHGALGGQGASDCCIVRSG